MAELFHVPVPRMRRQHDGGRGEAMWGAHQKWIVTKSCLDSDVPISETRHCAEVAPHQNGVSIDKSVRKGTSRLLEREPHTAGAI